MGALVTLIVRCVTILAGYAVATLAASAFFQLLAMGWVGFPHEILPWQGDLTMLFSVPVMALFVGYFAFMPALALIVAVELFGKRDWLFHALGGGAVGLVCMAFIMPYPDPEFLRTDLVLFTTALGAGIIGGIAYWLVAGHSAGNWRDRRPSDPPISREPSGS
jgi:hypothetical protein